MTTGSTVRHGPRNGAAQPVDRRNVDRCRCNLPASGTWRAATAGLPPTAVAARRWPLRHRMRSGTGRPIRSDIEAWGFVRPCALHSRVLRPHPLVGLQSKLLHGRALGQCCQCGGRSRTSSARGDRTGLSQVGRPSWRWFSSRRKRRRQRPGAVPCRPVSPRDARCRPSLGCRVPATSGSRSRGAGALRRRAPNARRSGSRE